MSRSADQREKHRDYMRAYRDRGRNEHQQAADDLPRLHTDRDGAVLAATREDLDRLTIPAGSAHLKASALALAALLDDPSRAPQFASVAARLTEIMASLVGLAAPRERDELDELRRAFYSGTVRGVNVDE